jgi:N6-L-threonylcarbamoyladenine synthase
MLILGIESSCDETSASVVRDGREILSLAIASQIAEHQPFGGVVPELASRGHMKRILPIIKQAMRDAGADWDAIDAIAATAGPGLVGALLVGCETAKAIAWLREKPFLPVHHLLGHIDSVHLALPKVDPATAPERVYPCLALVVSGGHTALYRVDDPATVTTLGETLDDAAGEAYDKVAKLLGLGYPGGPVIDRLARSGNPDAFDLPRPLARRESLDFSYSGLKTAVLTVARQLGPDLSVLSEAQIRDLCASFQKAAVDVLLIRLERAIKETGIRRLIIAGGVACNSRLRAEAKTLCERLKVALLLPAPILCADNAAMIAGQAWATLTRSGQRSWREGLGDFGDALDLNARANWPIESVATALSGRA